MDQRPTSNLTFLRVQTSSTSLLAHFKPRLITLLRQNPALRVRPIIKSPSRKCKSRPLSNRWRSSFKQKQKKRIGKQDKPKIQCSNPTCALTRMLMKASKLSSRRQAHTSLLGRRSQKKYLYLTNDSSQMKM